MVTRDKSRSSEGPRLGIPFSLSARLQFNELHDAKMSQSAWLWGFPHFSTILALASGPLQNLRESASHASTSLSDTSSLLQVVTVPTQNSPFSVRSPSSSSPSEFNTTEPSNARFTCNQDAYCSPNLQSCIAAWKGMPDMTDVVSFGEREAPDEWDVVLPFRFISRERGAGNTTWVHKLMNGDLLTS